MEWEFTPQQVVKGEADYSIDDFRRDLFCEVEQNQAGGDVQSLRSTYDLLFDLCYWLATERGFADFLAQYQHSPPILEFLKSVHPAMAPNAEMLGAVLQRMIMAEVENGVPLNKGVGNVYRIVAERSLTYPAGLPAGN